MKAAAAARTWWAALRRRTPESRAASGAARGRLAPVLLCADGARRGDAGLRRGRLCRHGAGGSAACRRAACGARAGARRGAWRIRRQRRFRRFEAAAGRAPRGPEGFALRHRRGCHRRARSAVAARRARPHRRLVQLGGGPDADPRRDLAVGADRRGRGRARRLRLSRRRPDPAAGALAGVEPQNHPQADPRGRADRACPITG